ncbi:hypothetical protein Vretifemale_9033 [Volvox reticuliferus]|uniref:Pherophorin domain-containing protein n=1 Tax=Volvox reticuliferus TaxID=1737510 RepID=A0A8J4CDW8_9CHLO|nr:hypothetical protein Vretifemale_9033 [Volvox reticuliferus]
MMKGGTLAMAVLAVAVVLTQAVTIKKFPYLPCAKKPTAYSVLPTVRNPDPKTFCFTIQVTATENCTSYCCGADLRKILIDVNPECAVQNPNIHVTLNDGPIKAGPAFEPGPNGPNNSVVLRLTQLGLNITTAHGAEVCISLARNSQGAGCRTMQEFCKPPAGEADGTCAVAMLDSQYDCCPIAKASSYVMPPPPPPESPPVLPAPEPCPVCVTLNRIEYFPLYPISFTAQQCQAWADMVVSNITAFAGLVDATLLNLPPAVKCEDDMLQACVKFASAEEGYKLEEYMEPLVQLWYSSFVNPCKAYWRGWYGASVTVNDGVDGSGCLQHYTSLVCDPAPIDFPKCKCDTGMVTPFFAAPILEKRPFEGSRTNDTLYCFTVFVSTPFDPDSPCGRTTNLLKAEIYADDAQRRKVKNILVRPNGANSSRLMSTSWASPGEQTLKVTPLNWNREQAHGASICLVVDNAADIGSFCNAPGSDTCTIIFFDDTKDCCPKFDASV